MGGIALGHWIGASGPRILTTLLYEMKGQACHKGGTTFLLVAAWEELY